MKELLKLITIVFLLVSVFYPVYSEWLDALINNSNNSHGLLIPLIAVYLIWERRSDLNSIGLSSSCWGLCALLISLSVYLLALLGGVAVVSRAMLVFSLASLTLYLCGAQFTRAIIFPLFFLLFTVPIPDSVVGVVAFPLQLLATQISAGIIKACSIPVVREGNMLYFVQTQLEVAEACSGIRSVMSLSMLSCLFVYFSPKGALRKIIILISAIPIALTANILRVSGTGILAHHFGERVAKGFLHDFSGLAVFLLGLLIMFSEFLVINKLMNTKSSQITRLENEK